ncbi:putative leucine-rich repeat-containing protein DDB_G0290503 [Clytia hemisphaerica]|uniref:putative leucine-rich repeat-containing protein DDB_G0290503 n=1 Tax=Clytia hemisphaerica TaxID=252671 RepID=UPI0034D68E61
MEDRNLAHSANDRNPPKKADSVEIQKLKEEHQKQIQKLTYESKIELMEAQMKNANLTHQLELLNLKHSHGIESKQIQADHELQNKLNEMEKQLIIKNKEIATKVDETKLKLNEKDKEIVDTKNQMTIKLNEKDKEIAAKDNECKMKLMTKDQEILGKENDFKLQIKDMENDHKLKLKDLENYHNLKLVALTKEKDATIQILRNEIGKLKLKNNQSNDVVKAKKVVSVKKEKPQKHFTKEEKLALGADTFFEGKKWEENVFESYEVWYREISLILTNRKQENVFSPIDGTEYVFIKREFGKNHKKLDIGFKEEVGNGYKEKDCDIMFEGVSKKTTNKGKFFLLHPTIRGKHLKFLTNDWVNWWWKVEIPEDFYFGDKTSAIVCEKLTIVTDRDLLEKELEHKKIIT